MVTSKITFHFVLKDQEGSIIDSSYDAQQPIEFEIGKKELSPAILEKKIALMAIGEQQTFSFTPKETFGMRDETRVLVLPISDIRLSHEGQNIERGQKVALNVPDSNMEDDQVFFTITSVMNGMVALDGNHPLAGAELTYEIEVLDIKEIVET